MTIFQRLQHHHGRIVGRDRAVAWVTLETLEIRLAELTETLGRVIAVIVLHDDQALHDLATQIDQLFGGRPLRCADWQIRGLSASLLGETGNVQRTRDEQQALRLGFQHVRDHLVKLSVIGRRVRHGHHDLAALFDNGTLELMQPRLGEIFVAQIVGNRDLLDASLRQKTRVVDRIVTRRAIDAKKIVVTTIEIH